MSEKLGIALFGCGRMGCIHAKNIMMTPRATLVWLVDDYKELAEKFKAEYNLDVTCLTSGHAEEVMNDKRVDGIIIATPTNTHSTLIRLALKAGKPVLCEKPITPDVDSTKECYSLSEQLDVPILCGFQRRHDPSIVKIKEAVKSGSAGQIRVLKTTCRDYFMPSTSYIQTSGGIFFDSTIHELDLCGWVCDSKPLKVFAQGHAFDKSIKQCGDFDQVLVTVQYANGAMSVNETSRHSPFGYDNRFEVLCEKSVFHVDNKPEDLLTIHGDVTTNLPRIHKSFVERYDEAYKQELEHFLDIILGEATPITTRDEVVQALRLAHLCQEAIRQGRSIDYTE